MSTRLNVAIVTQDDPFYIPVLLEEFFEQIGENVEVSRIVCLDPFNESFPKLLARVFRLFGTRGFIHHSISYMLRLFGEIIGIKQCSVGGVAKFHDVPIDYVQTVNTPDLIKSVEDENIDVVLSVSAPEVFDKALLSAPNWGCLNIHTAELPKYRGMMPTFWALYHGETEVGVTIHEMTEEIDAGRIASQTTFDVADLGSLHEVIRRGKKVGGRLAAETLSRVASGEITFEEMTGASSYYSFPTISDRKELESNGWRMR